MFKRLVIVGAFATLISSAAAAPAAAQAGVSIVIGHPVHQVAVGPYSGYVWQPEHYVWTAYGYQLVPGMWVPGPYVTPDAYYAPQYYPQQYYGPQYYARRPFYYGGRSVFWGANVPSFGFGVHFGNGHGHGYGHGVGYGRVGYGHGVGHGNGHGHGHR